MASISAGNQTTLRSKDIADKFDYDRRLYVFNDDTESVVWSGTITTASPTRGQQSFTVSGSYSSGFSSADIFRHQYVTIGSAAKGDDVSRRVLLTFDGSTIVLDYADDYEASNGDHLTIWNHYPVWSKLAYADYSDPSNIVFYQDGPPSGSGGAGITYSEATQLRPHVTIDIGAIVMREASLVSPSTVTFAPDIELTNPSAASSTITVTVSPSSIGTITNPVPGAYQFEPDAYGRGVLHVKVDDNVSGSTTIHRPIIVENPASPIHIKEFQFNRPADTRGQITPGVDITINAPDDSFSGASNAIDWTSVRSHSLVIITQTDTFGSTETFIRANLTKLDPNVIYMGYVVQSRENHISGQDEPPSVTLSLDPMPITFTYALAISGKTTPISFLEARSSMMNVAGQAFLVLDGYTTATQVMEVHLPWTDTAKRAENLLFGRGSVFNGLSQLARSRLYDVTILPTNRIRINRNLNYEDSTDRSVATTTITMQIGDVTSSRNVNVEDRKSIIRTLLSGGTSDGNIDSGGRFTPYLLASGNVPSAEALPSEPDNRSIVMADVTEGKLFAQRLNTIANQEYQSVTITLPDRYHQVFEVDSLEKINLGTLVSASDVGNLRANADLANDDCVVQSVAYGAETITVTLIPIPADGPDSVELPQPEVPSATDSSTFPALYDVPTNVTTPPSTSGTLIVTDLTSGVYITEDSGGTWTASN